MKRYFFTGLLALCFTMLSAQNELVNLRIEARADYQREYIDDSEIKKNCGFEGKYLNIRMDGNIGYGFSYSYRQRLNKPNKDASFFDATDWIYLTYTHNNWSFSGGKQVVGIGGYEYDRAPIDLYFCSEYWNNIPCYRIGVSAAYTTDSGNDKFVAQICESPWRTDDNDTYAYNLMWYGTHGWFSTIYSINMIEVYPGKYINYIALGNRFNFGDFTVNIDLMNRSTDEHTFIGKDLSIMGEVAWMPTESLNIFAKATYDVNNTNSTADLCVLPGTEITRVGAGVEFYPLDNGKNKDVRLHANASYTFGDNGNTAGILADKQSYFDIGATWRINLLSLKR